MADVWLAALPWLSPRLMEDFAMELALLPALILLWALLTLAVSLLLVLGVLVKNALGSLSSFFAVPAPVAGQQSWASRDRQAQRRGETR
jgi:hypothetical protein